MAEDTKKLTQEERDQIVQWLKKSIGDTKMPCPVCKNDDWYVPESLAAMPIVSGGGTVSFSSIFPYAPVICQVCGYTFFVNSMRMGLSKPKEKVKEQNEDDTAASDAGGQDG